MNDIERQYAAEREANGRLQDALIQSRHEVDALRSALTTIAYPPSGATDWTNEWNPIVTARAALNADR